MKSTDRNKNKHRLFKTSTGLFSLFNVNAWIWIFLAAILGITFVIYFKSFKFDLMMFWDDQAYITQNSHITDLSFANIKLFFTRFYVSNYQPLTMLTYALDTKLGAGNPFFYHFSNVLLHGLNSLLVFVLIRKISPQSFAPALITAAFFAVHPMHVESVAWVSERKDVLYSFFFLLSLIMYCNYLKLLKFKFLGYSAVFMILSCLSKSAAVVLPLVMLLFDYYLGRKFTTKVLIEKVPFLAIALLIGVLAFYSQKGAMAGLSLQMTFLDRISVISFSFLSYLVKAFIPVNLSALYPYPVNSGNGLPLIYYFSVLGLGVGLYLIRNIHKQNRDIFFGLFFFLITIVLVLQFFPVGFAIMADRYTYIPYIGIFYMVGKLYEHVSFQTNAKYRIYQRIILVALFLGFVTFSVIAYNRVKVWENDETLFTDVIRKQPKTSTPYYLRGLYYVNYFVEKKFANNEQDRILSIKKSIADFEIALTYPLAIPFKADVYYNLGIGKMRLGEYKSAIDNFNKVIELDTVCAAAYYFRAETKSILKDNEGALSDYNQSLRLYPQDASSYLNRGTLKKDMGDYTAALRDFDRAVNINPLYAKAYLSRAALTYKLKQFKSAQNDSQKALKLIHSMLTNNFIPKW